MALEGKTDMDKLKSLSAKKFKDQAVWFLNGYWEEIFEKDMTQAENVYQWVKIHEDICPKKKNGAELNEFDAHRFLEKINETLSVKDMRAFLKSVDIDFNKMVSLTEYLVSKYRVQWKELVHKPQDDKQAAEERKAAQAAVDLAAQKTEEASEAHKAAAEREQVAKDEKKEASEKAGEAAKKSAAAKAKEEESAEAETKAKAAAAASQKAYDESKAAADEQKKALDKVLAEEKKYNDAMADFKVKSEDMSLGAVKRNKAANQLAQLKAKPTLGLQTAKVTLTAAEKRAKKAAKKVEAATRAVRETAYKAEEALKEAKEARKASEEAEKLAKEAENEATQAANAAEEARKVAEAAVEAARKAFAEAEEELKKLLAKPVSSGQGSRWFLNREFEDMKQYMPKSKLKKLKALKQKDTEVVAA
eukprot:CAMPEP_0184493252 /NCGR_PEP_ID=MMETSP0113_2-20130426/25499_1 /TAXON_ID=91329 /ORGANISM="Norrisiella sphaerica, Strain BC52" /LENGTH=418 /DNA_ID=CAMNT_0026878453 /DNA_START=41 /DNA_END=1297 /DNA_ORIENTATION=+